MGNDILNELLNDDDDNVVIGDVKGERTYLEVLLDSYFKESYELENVPLLIGATATLKSALVEKYAEENGYRLIDLRTSFMSRLDIEGLMERVDVEGSVESYNAGIFNLIECTDEFIDFCRRSVNIIEDKLEKDELSNDEKVKMEDMLDYYKEKSKPAVLFFDEVTRADEPILNALTTILNKKEVLGYEITYSKIITATNLPIGMSEDLKRLYSSANVDDIALAERFEPIKITPDDVESIWDRWSEEGEEGICNIHPVIRKFLNNFKEYKYDYSGVIEKARDGESGFIKDKGKLYSSPFPNYRTWELLSNYMYKKEDADSEKQYISKNIIEGLIGEEVASTFITSIEKCGWRVYDDSEERKMGVMVEECLETNTPLMLLGPTSIGKCLVGDSIIKTEEGLRRLDSFDYVDDEGFMENDYRVDTIDGIKETSHTYTEKSEVWEVKDKNGLSIEGTLNHPLLVLDVKEGVKWKKIMNIKEGDYILSKRNNNFDVERDDYAYLGGLFLGDCTIRSPKNLVLTIDKGKDKIENLIQDLGFKKVEGSYFKCVKDQGKVYRKWENSKKNKNVIDLSVYNFEGKIDVDKHKFPKEGSFEYLLNYIAGYVDSDGYVNNLTGYIEFGCESKNLIKDLQIVLNSLGFKGRRYKKYNKEYEKYYYYLYLNKDNSIELAKQIKNLSRIKKDQLEKLIKIGNKRYKRDVELGFLEGDLLNLCCMDARKRGRTLREYRDVTEYNFERLFYGDGKVNITKLRKYIDFVEVGERYIDDDLLLLSNMRASKVVNKKKKGEKRVYDITVPSNESFIANGICSHNTASIQNKANKLGIKEDNIIKIVLSQQDSIDIMGPPTKVDLVSYVAGLGRESREDIEVIEELKEEIKQSDLPEKVTIKAPRTNLADKVRQAMKNNEQMVIFFDEFNRVIDDKVMTAVFESISNNRIFGVEFDPDLVTVIVAGNIGREYSGAQDLDPAYSARFCVLRREKYKEKDVEAFKSWMKRNDYNIYIREFIDSKSKEEVLEFISSVEQRSLENAVPSMRAFTNLNSMLEGDNENINELKGTILFSSNRLNSMYEEVVNVSSPDLGLVKEQIKKIVDNIKEKWDNWTVINSNMSVEINYKEISGKELINMVKELYRRIYIDEIGDERELYLMRDMLVALFSMEQDIVELREDIFATKLGREASNNFNSFYSLVSGTKFNKIDISDLGDNINVIEKYFNQKLSGNNNQDKKINKIIEMYGDFADEFGDKLEQEYYQKFVMESIQNLSNMDARNNLFKKLEEKRKLNKIITQAEFGDYEFIKEEIKLISGREVTEEEIKRGEEIEMEEVESDIL